ncbi:hypothetical protein [Gloeothece verrucosa]|uniref:Uncharacterized protein n=1 Tax=Gloeothece verrucosa (strain PCC 7822) TaxID=497965 RepID=E0UMT3_GLOV7|nr:hypothetical protein [Gloeothece verrucosa]ADN18263.1 hypothetical protein Cyan7822_6486 [Gloeothece verrucosa PCC 7822]
MIKRLLFTTLSLILTAVVFFSLILAHPHPVLAKNTSSYFKPLIKSSLTLLTTDNRTLKSKSLTVDEEEKTFTEQARNYVDLLVNNQINLHDELTEVKKFITQSQKKDANFKADETYKLYQAIKEEISQRLPR